MKTKSRNLIISFLLTLAMLLGVFAMTPLTAFAISDADKPAETVYIGDVALTEGQYVKNGETTATTGEPNWEESGFAFYASSGVLHLSDYQYEGTGYTHDTSEKSAIYSTGKLEVILHGTSSIKNTADAELWSANGIRAKGNLIIDGPGSITVDAPYAICGDALVEFQYGKTLIPDAVIAIEAGGNFIVSGGYVELHSTQPIDAVASSISGGSFTATAEQGVFKAAPTISVDTEDVYWMKLSYNVDGSNPQAYIPGNITQYKYFAVLPPTPTEIDSISVSGVVVPEVGDSLIELDLYEATYGENYFLDSWGLEVYMGGRWIEAEGLREVTEGLKYRFILWICPKDGYNIPADISGDDISLNGGQVTEFKINEYPDYNELEIYYEFHYGELIDPLITSIEISGLTLPVAGQRGDTWPFNPAMLTFGGNYDFDYCRMEEYNGTEWVLTESDTILAEVRYRFVIVLCADEGYFFSPELTSDDVTIGDDDAVLVEIYPTGEYAVVAAEFYYEASSTTPITSISVSGADLPEVGETKDVMEFTPDSLTYGGEYKMVGRGFQKYTGTGWVDVSDTESLEYGVKYRVNLILAPNEGYAFADSITSDDVTFNGKEGIFETLISGVGYASIFYEFSYEAPATDYGITIADKDDSGATVGVLITEENCTDVLGDGTVSYNATTNTLTLNNYVYSGVGADDCDIGYYGLVADIPAEGLTIVLVGTNSITVSGNDSAGMIFFGSGDLIIKGNGSLSINSGMFGITVQTDSGKLTIENAKFNITTTGAMAIGVQANDFVMNSGNLKITASMIGIGTSEEEGIHINGGSVEIGTAIGGYAFIYWDSAHSTFNPVTPDLSNYVGDYNMIAGVDATGSDAGEFNESYLSSYKYVKIEPTHVHDHGTTWESDANEHWNECECGDKANKAAHSGGTATCQAKAKCEVCNAEYGELAACAGGTATCTEKAKCATCGNEYGELAPHNYNITNGYKGAYGHANTCSCGAHDTPVAHTPDRTEATETDPVKCTVCGYIIEPIKGHVHAPKSEWKSDEDNHWHECTGCEGQQLEKAAHTDSNNDGKCDTCEYQMSTTPDNPNNTPDNPNSTPDDPSGDKDGLGTGAIVGIVIGSVAVVGIGGFALFWFVIKKKTWADFLAIFKKK